MSKHKHAELMAEYAKDAMETDKPWERWEERYSKIHGWGLCDCAMYWHDSWEYRRKAKTSRERFEEWYNQSGMGSGLTAAWEAWQEAERQAKESSDG